jgi:hypothetical protein
MLTLNKAWETWAKPPELVTRLEHTCLPLEFNFGAQVR